MFRIVFFQAMVTLLCALVAGFAAGTRGALSAALGGMVYTVPSALFALSVRYITNQEDAKKAGRNFLLGAVFKLTAIAGFLYCIIRWGEDLSMPLVLVGLALAVQAVFLTPFMKK